MGNSPGCIGAGNGHASADLQVTDLVLNDHACLTFGDEEELLDLTAAFIRDGLASGFKVISVASSPERSERDLADRGVGLSIALASGQLSTVGFEGHVLSQQAFQSAQAAEWLTSQIAACQDEGFPGLRVALDMSWALRPVSGVEQLADFEQRAADVITSSKATLLCQYDRERFDPVTLGSVAPLHTRSVAAATYHADAVLRICRQYAPPGVRLAGELDYRAGDALALALAEALRIDTDITVTMADLSFIDASCVRMILDAARGLEADRGRDQSRKMILRCNQEIARLFRHFGATGAPGVSMVKVRDSDT